MRLLALPFLALTAAPWSAQSTILQHLGDSADGEFGSTVERIGDVNNDGVRDYAVGAPFSDATIFLGFPVHVDDVGVVRVYSGVEGTFLWDASGPINGGGEFGHAIADAGDVNFDGYDDVLISAPGADGLAVGSGYVQLRSGLDGSVLKTFHGQQTYERYGEAICVGELDGNFASREVAIGAPGHDLHDNQGAFLEEGRVEIVDLGTGLPELFLPGTPYEVVDLFSTDVFERKRWGAQLVYIGDSDNDGYGSLVVSAPNTKHHDEVFLQGTTLVPNTGFIRRFEPFDPAPVLNDESWFAGGAGEQYGMLLKAFDADLYGNGLVEWAYYAHGSGQIKVHSGMGTVPKFEIWSSCATGLTSIADVGDWNDDGFVDLALGVESFGDNPGQVCIRSGIGGTLLTTFSGDQPGGRYGSGVAGSDLNGDGVIEVWVGARYDDSAMSNAGGVFIESESPCLGLADWGIDDWGQPGQLGIPQIGTGDMPVPGTAFGIQILSASDQPRAAGLVIGLQTIQVPMLGGTLHVYPHFVESFLLQPGSMTLPLVLPSGPAMCGLEVHFQVIHEDPSAWAGWAFTPRMWAKLGT